jgi:hypothetical protein
MVPAQSPGSREKLGKEYIKMSRSVLPIGILIAAGYVCPARGQVGATTLVIELDNVVEYQVDTSDLSKYGTDPNVTQGKIARGVGVGCAGNLWPFMEI